MAKVYYDKSAKNKSSLKEGQSVLLKKDNCQVPAEVIARHETPRSYIVKDQNMHLFRRNSSFLKPSPNPFEAQSSQDDFNDNVQPVQPDKNEISNVLPSASEPGVTNEKCPQSRSGRAIVKPIRYRQ